MRSFISLLFLLTQTWLFSQDNADRDRTPKYSNEFLQLGVGARSFGMALSTVAVVDDVTSGYWNPAGLMKVSGRQGMLMHASYFGGLANYDFGAFTTSYDDNSKIALSIIRFSVDDIPDTRFLFDADGTINYDNIQFFAAADYAFIGSYARKLDWFGGVNAGGSVKVIHRTVGDFSKSWGFGFDFGFSKEIGKWQFGLVARDALGTFNAWSHNVDELEDAFAITGNALPENSVEVTVPRLLIGVARSFKVSEKVSVLSSLDIDFTFDGERNTLISSSLTSIDPHAGIELGYSNKAFLRLGIGQFQQTEDFSGNQSWSMQPTAGIGFSLGEIVLDYALTDAFNQAPGLYSHIFSVKIDFNEKD